MGLCLSLEQCAHSVPAEVILTVIPGNLSMQVTQADTCKDAIGYGTWSSWLVGGVKAVVRSTVACDYLGHIDVSVQSPAKFQLLVTATETARDYKDESLSPP